MRRNDAETETFETETTTLVSAFTSDLYQANCVLSPSN